MQFLQSETIINLARAFAGESQARNRYLIFAGRARQDGHEIIARLFEETAHNEFEHAEQFYALLNELSEQAPVNLRIDAGYPYPLGSTVDNLGYAADGEHEEHADIYPTFARIAREEGITKVANKFELIAQVELTHQTRFAQMQRQLTSGMLYHSDTPVIWRCTNCGHIHLSTDPWQVCPICQKDRGWAEQMPNWTQSGPR